MEWMEWMVYLVLFHFGSFHQCQVFLVFLTCKLIKAMATAIRIPCHVLVLHVLQVLQMLCQRDLSIGLHHDARCQQSCHQLG